MNNKKYIDLEDLEVYQIAREMSKLGWKIYEKFDWQIKKVIGDQFIRAIDSTGANIAEGYGRENTGNYIQFLRIAQGSCKEVETHALLAQRVLDDITSPQKLLDQCDAVGKMLHGLIRSLQ